MISLKPLPSLVGSSWTVSGVSTAAFDSFFATLALRLLEDVFWTIGMSLNSFINWSLIAKSYSSSEKFSTGSALLKSSDAFLRVLLTILGGSSTSASPTGVASSEIKKNGLEKAEIKED